VDTFGFVFLLFKLDSLIDFDGGIIMINPIRVSIPLNPTDPMFRASGLGY